MRGFTSASRSKDEAIKFAVHKVPANKRPVLMCIEYHDEGRDNFKLDSAAYTEYTREEEVLLQDGLLFRVLTVD